MESVEDLKVVHGLNDPENIPNMKSLSNLQRKSVREKFVEEEERSEEGHKDLINELEDLIKI